MNKKWTLTELWIKTWNRCLKKYRLFWVSGAILSLWGLLSFGPVLAPGIDSPTPVGAYLNGVFPTEAPTGSSDNWEVENAFPNLTFPDPVAMLEIPGESSYFVVGKVGKIYQIPDESTTTTSDVVLDISAMVDTDGDSGLLNGILHPEFGQPGSDNRGYIYLLYRFHPDGNITDCEENAFVRLSRFNRPDGSNNFDPASEYVLIQVYDEHCWHNGSGMFFDEEGFFYLTIGDAGGADDQYNTTQKLNERLLGGLFKIDLEMDASRSHPIRRQQVDPPYMPFTTINSFSQGYFIPNDNPWLDEGGGVLEEFYALGLRSPHRAAYDPETGDIYIGDVGQGTREEISVAKKGDNLQWPFGEGSIAGSKAPPNPLIGVSTPPVFDYSHAVGNSIIGGFVYRGDKFQGALDGKYLFADHGVRNVWTFNPANGEVVYLLTVPSFGEGEKNGISSFATNAAGDVFILKLYGTDLDGGVIYKLKQSSAVPEPPALLSQTGAFTDLSSLTPAAGLVPYEVGAPLWSDRAEKKRWIALPNDGTHDTAAEQITFSANGKWQFPAGTVFIKHFELPLDYNDPGSVVPVETRFMVVTADGGSYGVTYKWRDDGTDADLIIGGESKDFTILNGPNPTQSWDFPSRAACKTCHNANADFVLGVNTWQLNNTMLYPSGIADNQLSTWHHLGMFANPFDLQDITGFLRTKNISDASASLESRVRSYLDANCAHCHQPNGVEGAFDARFTTAIGDQNIVNFMGISRNTPEGHYVVKSQNTALSELWLRDNSVGPLSMPPLAKNVVDDTYISVLTDWINSLDEVTCFPASLTNLNWSMPPINFYGPVEINRSNGEGEANDGGPISINGQVFEKGLGVHAPSEVKYDLMGNYSKFETYVGVDDEVLECTDAAVQFEIYVDGIRAFQSPIMRAGDAAILASVNVVDANELKLVVTDGGNDVTCDHADWAGPTLFPCVDCVPGTACDDGNPCTTNDQLDAICNCVGTLLDSDGDGVCDLDDLCPGFDDTLDADNDGIPDGCDDFFCPNTYLSDLTWEGTPVNAYGPVELDQSVGESGLGDGGPITIAGQVFAKGLGVHAASEIIYNITGSTYQLFKTYIGVDDEACEFGSVIFEIYRDNVLAYQSPLMNRGDAAIPVMVDVQNVNQLKLVTTIGNADDACDHADWANARFLDCVDCIPGSSCDDGNSCTTNDQLNQECNCVGILIDADGDGVCDTEDLCPGFDDTVDVDNDGIPDGCDDELCPVTFLSDIPWEGTPVNPYGPVELDMSVGDADVGDGGPITINGEVFAKGLGVHAAVEIIYDLSGGGYESFKSSVGIDDEACEFASVIFEVYTDNTLAYQSPMMVKGATALPVDVNVLGVSELKLVVSAIDNDDACDHADWGGARLENCCASGDQTDADNDGIPDACDNCVGLHGEVCPSGDCEVNNDPIPSNTYGSTDQLMSAGRVAGGSTVVFEAVNRIVLKPGFKAEAGSNFKALIVDCQEPQQRVQSEPELVTERENRQLTETVSAPVRHNRLEVSLSPNPFHGNFTLHIRSPFPEMKRAVIRILDTSGRIFYQRFDVPFDEDLVIQSHSGWPSGLYLVQIRASDYSYVQRIVKQ